MKKIIGVSLIILLSLAIVGCTANESSEESDTNTEVLEPTSFTATIDEVSDAELLVTVLDNDNFNQARINLDGFDGMNFEPEVGQTIAVTITNQVGMSEPPFCNPISIELAE